MSEFHFLSYAFILIYYNLSHSEKLKVSSKSYGRIRDKIIRKFLDQHNLKYVYFIDNIIPN